MIAKEGNEGFLKASHKLKQFQVMELSLVVDECLNFVSDMKYFKEKISEPFKKSKGNSIKTDKDNFVGLGIDSKRNFHE